MIATHKLRPTGSFFEDNCDDDKMLLYAKSSQPKLTDPCEPFIIKKFDIGEDRLQRQSSILSFQNLSIGDCTSVCDSQYSHLTPSINEPFVSEDATAEEKAMHCFLDNAGIFQVNIKQQLEEEKAKLERVSGY